MLMILAASTDMDKNDRHIATRLIIEGFNDQATAANTKVTGGQTVVRKKFSFFSQFFILLVNESQTFNFLLFSQVKSMAYHWWSRYHCLQRC
jgi:hypothetical protein